MKNNILTICLAVSFLMPEIAFAQAPAITWQNTIGGNLGDYFQSAVQTPDGGYILCGFSYSDISGDKTEANYGNSDYWIVKVSATGAIDWQNSIGGSGYDEIYSALPTPDGGYILGGRSSSGISGDKTVANWVGGLYGYDYWIIKLNASGAIEWQKVIGGTDDDNLFSLNLTSDGGYILGGYSLSGISGDKTEPNLGGYDYWVVKLNAAGDLVWQNTIGGNNTDYLTVVKQTSDGGYILGGYSISGISGDKTEPSLGVYDFWIVKLNSSGMISWQNTIGGLSSEYLRALQQTSDGGYIIGGPSGSGVSGDKTEGSYDGGLYKDYWVLKLNSTGHIVWQNTIGGSGDDVLVAIQQTTDGGYILGGYSSSGISGEKTEASMGNYDYWIIQLNTSGVLQWQNGVGGSSADYLGSIQQTTDGGLMVGGYSYSGISGDKTEAAVGNLDFWIIKFGSDCALIPEVCNALDDNCNGLIDEGVIETITVTAAGATTVCQGSSVLLSATYSGTSVQWLRNGNNIVGATSATYAANKTGSYTCNTSSACASAVSLPIMVTINKNPAATISADGPITFCVGGSVILTASAGTGITYQWYKNGAAITGATSNAYEVFIAGNYKCLITKTTTGCFKYSNTIKVTTPCKTQEGILVAENSIDLYPNPATQVLNIYAHSNPIGTVQIFNSTGQLIYTNYTATESIQIKVKDFPGGLYIIQIQSASGITQKEFVKE